MPDARPPPPIRQTRRAPCRRRPTASLPRGCDTRPGTIRIRRTRRRRRRTRSPPAAPGAVLQPARWRRRQCSGPRRALRIATSSSVSQTAERAARSKYRPGVDSARRVQLGLNPQTMPVPEWLVPMAATLTQERFDGPEWLFERKFDGIRLLAFKDGAQVRLLSRNKLPQHWPELSGVIADLPVRDVVLDGEAAGDTYHVFDILWFHGRSVPPGPREQRRELLAGLPSRPPMKRVAALEGAKPWERA